MMFEVTNKPTSLQRCTAQNCSTNESPEWDVAMTNVSGSSPAELNTYGPFFPKNCKGLEQPSSRESSSPHPQHLHHKGVEPSLPNQPFFSLSLCLFFLSYTSLYLSVYLLHPPTPSTYNGLLVNPECIKDEKGAAVRFEHWHRTQPPCILACTSAVSKCSHFWPRLFTLHLWRSLTQHKVNSLCHVGLLSTLLTDWNYSKC